MKFQSFHYTTEGEYIGGEKIKDMFFKTAGSTVSFMKINRNCSFPCHELSSRMVTSMMTVVEFHSETGEIQYIFASK